MMGTGKIGAALSWAESGPDFCIPFICAQVNKNFDPCAPPDTETLKTVKNLSERAVDGAGGRRCRRIPDFISRFWAAPSDTFVACLTPGRRSL